MEERARTATSADLDRLCALAEEVIDELAPTKGGGVWVRRDARRRPVRSSIEAALDADDHLVVAGELGDAVVGYAVARLERLEDGGLLTVLDDIYVEPGARAVGVGELLMDQVVAWARAKGSFGIDSLALPGNRATKNFFESFGMVARAIVVHRPLSEEGPPSS